MIGRSHFHLRLDAYNVTRSLTIAHSSEFAAKAGVAQKVGKDFAAADKAKKKSKAQKRYTKK